MPISGYDPADLDDALELRLTERDLDDLLGDDERRRYRAGESLLELLDEEQIQRVLERTVETSEE